ncbi:MAG: tRNA (adenosine(37)-N6)-dimethylallyltransferase MiaA [Planctomycetota bacterium]
MDAEPPLLVLTGPTASGKSGLALLLAERHGLEVLSADSMSVYRGMDIGTAKPTPEERRRVPHHGLDLVDASEDFDSARYVAVADAAIAGARARGARLLVAGGTPLYLMALLRGFFDGPSRDPALRARLEAEEDDEPGLLWRRLSEVDPVAAERIHARDRRRLVRALEVHELSGRPISEQQRQFEEGPPRYPYVALGLERPRDELRARVRRRCRAMFEGGLVDEVRALLTRGGFSATAREAIGYREVLTFLDGGLKAEELEYRVRSNTPRLVRRQTTWFRRFPGLTRVDAGDRPVAELAETFERGFGLVAG